ALCATSVWLFHRCLRRCCYVFHRYVAPEFLHSFPTRRSSDLAVPAAQAVRPERRARGPGLGRRRPDPRPRARRLLRRRAGPSRRSEEHTSELQSRENLVCRLLLEKKKNTTIS